MASRNAHTVVRLVALVVGMFGFGFALVPLYDLLCEVTGLGGRTGGVYAYDAASVATDRSRLVKVSFVTNANEGMPWEFWTETPIVRVHPGELTEVMFYARNPTNRVMVGQAIPSVVPLPAAEHFHKTQCFCFERQVLQPGETAAMPMRFLLAPELPRHLQSVSLSYAMFDVTELAAADGAAPGA
jgi:cytochrome c oxidase assembly protein subunit 11